MIPPRPRQRDRNAMNNDQINAFRPLTLKVRRLFHKLANGAAALHRNSDISIGMRDVLESVIDGGPQTVPHMARIRPVTRQHIQGLVNALLDENLVEYIDNPAHKRSRLVAPTSRGRQVFAAMRAKEIEAFERADIAASPEDLAAATRVLTAVIATFDGPEWQAIIDDLSSRDAAV